MRARYFFLQLATLATFFFSAQASAQLQNASSDVATPIPGAGHDYLHAFSETVNPMSGSLSIRIDIPIPPGRGVTIPFALLYNSVGINQPYFVATNDVPSWVTFANQGTGTGWVYSLPSLTALDFKYSYYNQHGHPPATYSCSWISNFMFQAMDSSRHMLQISIGEPVHSGGDYCGNGFGAPSNFLVGGDGVYLASTTNPYGTGAPIVPAPVSVAGLDGTVYSFSSFLGTTLGPVTSPGVGTGAYASVASVEDRNGNITTATSNPNTRAATVTDSLGRTAIQASAITSNQNTISVSGISNPFNIQWTSASSSFTTGANDVESPKLSECSGSFLANPQTSTVIQTLTLPNGQSYQFGYDSTYGLLNYVKYPTGATVTYTWAENTLAEYTSWEIARLQGSPFCISQYGIPAISKRVVSFDGVNAALEQDFTYSTTWPSAGYPWSTKKTIVKTYDRITNQSFETIYNYSATGIPSPPNQCLNAPCYWTPSVTGVETSVIQYADMGITTLKTTNKGWLDQYRLACEITTLDSGQIFGSYYANGLILPSDNREFDFGLISNASSCTPPSGINPSRETLYSYAAFPVTPSFQASPSILNRPSSIVISGNGTRIAETDYSYDQTAVSSATTPPGTHDDVNYGPAYNNRGNATTVTRKCLQSCSDSSATYLYDETGQTTQFKDALGNPTIYTYTDNFDSNPTYNTNAYLTKLTDPQGHTLNFKYAFSDGQLISSTSQNGQITSYLYNDSLRRLTETDFPDLGKTSLSYNDSPPSPSITTTRWITTSSMSPPSVSVSSTSVMDGLGHVTQTQLTSDPDGITYSDTRYDGFGRVYCKSNPYRSTADGSFGITTYVYDALNRVAKLQPPDYWANTSASSPTCQNLSQSTTPANPTNYVATTYSGNATTVTDQAGKSRKSVTDGLGRLAQVFEDPANLNYETDYQYDGLNNLLCIAQKGTNSGTFSNCTSTPASWRPRTFTYNSLSQLTGAVNPESGTTSYTYTVTGNVATKTAPAPNQTGTSTVTTTYFYDSVNHLTKKSYSDGTTPTVQYAYSGATLTGCTTAPPALTDSYPIGTRTAMCDGAGAESWSHDSIGRVLGDQRTTNGVTYGFPQTYNLDGSVSTLNYGNYSGSDLVTFVPGGAGRTVSETGTVNSWTIVSAAHYAPNGALCGLSYYGAGAAENISFNNRFQPLHWHVSSTPWGGNPAPPPCQPPSWTASWLDFAYNYVDSNGHNNGNVQSIFNNANHYFSTSFTYDSLDRIATAQTNGVAGNQFGCWAETYTIDPWGNLYQFGINTTTQSAWVGCAQESGLTTQANTNNQLINYGYDAAGNMISVPSVANYTYDAENHLISTAGYTYSYDGDGKRVMKSSGSSGTIYWYGVSSMPLFETTLTGGGNFAYYYFNGRVTNRREFAHYFTPDIYVHDALGNTTLVGGYNGAWDNSDYYPFGGEWVHYSQVGNHYKFTGKERDPESGLDNFGARYDSSAMGRFMSPDPLSRAGLPVDTHDPQSWNAYAYVGNNPINLTDPDGTNHLVCDQNGKNCADLTNQQYDRYLASLKGTNTIVTSSGQIQIQNANGSFTTIGTEKYHNERDIHAAGQIGQYATPVEVLGMAELLFLGPYAGPALLGTAPEIGLGGLGLAGGGLVIGKMADLENLGPGERTLGDRGQLPDQGSYKANWEQNAGRLRFEMGKNEPIRDASLGTPESGFYRAERNLLRDHGWSLQNDGYWHPPASK